MSPAELLQQMRDGTLHACDFGHREHVSVAFQALEEHDFFEATALFARGIRAAAAASGASDKFNATVTFAFMSLIAERRAAGAHADADAFLSANPDLLGKQVLAPWYSEERLRSALAREVALLPDRVAG